MFINHALRPSPMCYFSRTKLHLLRAWMRGGACSENNEPIHLHGPVQTTKKRIKNSRQQPWTPCLPRSPRSRHGRPHRWSSSKIAEVAAVDARITQLSKIAESPPWTPPSAVLLQIAAEDSLKAATVGYPPKSEVASNSPRA